MSDLQELSGCHPNFFLCQFIQSPKRTLDVGLSQQPLQIFSNQGSAESIQIQGYGKLTCSSLFYLLCRYSKDIEYFNHYLHDDVRHCRRWWDLGTGLEAFEKVLDPLKDVDEDLFLSIFRRFSELDLGRQLGFEARQ